MTFESSDKQTHEINATRQPLPNERANMPLQTSQAGGESGTRVSSDGGGFRDLQSQRKRHKLGKSKTSRRHQIGVDQRGASQGGNKLPVTRRHDNETVRIGRQNGHGLGGATQTPRDRQGSSRQELGRHCLDRGDFSRDFNQTHVPNYHTPVITAVPAPCDAMSTNSFRQQTDGLCGSYPPPFDFAPAPRFLMDPHDFARLPFGLPPQAVRASSDMDVAQTAMLPRTNFSNEERGKSRFQDTMFPSAMIEGRASGQPPYPLNKEPEDRHTAATSLATEHGGLEYIDPSPAHERLQCCMDMLFFEIAHLKADGAPGAAHRARHLDMMGSLNMRALDAVVEMQQQNELARNIIEAQIEMNFEKTGPLTEDAGVEMVSIDLSDSMRRSINTSPQAKSQSENRVQSERSNLPRGNRSRRASEGQHRATAIENGIARYA